MFLLPYVFPITQKTTWRLTACRARTHEVGWLGGSAATGGGHGLVKCWQSAPFTAKPL